MDGANAAIEAAGKLGPLRALVNSAGLGWAGRTVDRGGMPIDLERFEFVIRVNLIGSFNMLSRSAAAMAKTDPLDADGARGAIVNMASVAALGMGSVSRGVPEALPLTASPFRV